LGLKKGTLASLRQRYAPGARVSPSALALEVLQTMADKLGLPLTPVMVEALVKVEGTDRQSSMAEKGSRMPVFNDRQIMREVMA
jgi:hypothetical protein